MPNVVQRDVPSYKSLLAPHHSLPPSLVCMVAVLVLDPVVEVSVSDADVSVEVSVKSPKLEVKPSAVAPAVVETRVAKWTCGPAED